MQFIDKCNIEVKAGKGGAGCISHDRKCTFCILLIIFLFYLAFYLAPRIVGPVPGVKIPSGGNGGAGGSVYIVADSSLTSLSLQVSHFNAENGGNGGGMRHFYGQYHMNETCVVCID